MRSLLLLFLVLNFSFAWSQNTDKDFYNLALKQIDAEQYKEATENLDKAIEINDKNANYFILRAKAKRLRNKFDPAIKDCSRALLIDPYNDQAFYGRANARSLQGDFELALPDYTKAIELNPNFEDAYIDQALTYVLIHKRKEGAKVLQTMANKLPKYNDLYIKKGIEKMLNGDDKGACADWNNVSPKAKLAAENLINIFCGK
jgi:tetratricopeptide (TPR) repeat protein